MTDEKEKEIIHRICAGEQKLYQFIVESYQQRVASLCYKMGVRSCNIEEVSQQVFIELYTALKRFRFQSKFGTFVYKLTVNTVSKSLRKNKRILFIENDLALNQLSENDTEEKQLQEERFANLHKAIEKLKEKQRIALCLHVFEDVPYKEIALTMNISDSAVESLIFRAKLSLKDILQANIEK